MTPADAPQICNRTIFTGDNLPILRAMAAESVDLIYLDPPFNSKRRHRAVRGSAADGAAFKDAWSAADVGGAWPGELRERCSAALQIIDAVGNIGERGDHAYLLYMAVRLLELRRVLKADGSIYLHIDPTMSHALKLVMDAIFGCDNFRNEVIWRYGLGGGGRRVFSQKHDVILFYSKGARYFFDKPRVPATSHRLRGRMKGATDVFDIPSLNNMANERTGYPTQKPLALLLRIIGASCPRGGVVLDPFCGSATTLLAAQRLGARWVGIDISARAVQLARARMQAFTDSPPPSPSSPPDAAAPTPPSLPRAASPPLYAAS